MTYTLSLVDTESRDLVVNALRAEADRRGRAAERIAGMVRQDKAAGQDVRTSSVRVTVLLGEAAELRAAADTLAEAQDLVLVATTPVVNAATGAPIATAISVELIDGPPTLPGLEGDGTSPQAQAMADLAGLTGYDPDEDDTVDVDALEVTP